MFAHGTPPPERFNFAYSILERNALRGGKPAYIDDVGTLSFGDLDRRVRSAAAAYLALGLRREERVLLCLHDTVDFPVAFLGALYAGVVPVAVNTLLTADDYAYMLAHSRAQALLVSGALLPTLQQAMARGGHDVKHIIVSRAGWCACPKRRRILREWSGSAGEMAQPADTAADEMAFWLYSSGSTGRPKGTVHTHANLHWTAELYGKPVLGLRENDVVFSAAKLFFAYGLGNALTFPLSVGATTILMAERATPQAVFKRLVQYKPTIFCGVPTLYAAMLSSPELPTRDDVAMRRCISAGEALPREVGERFAARSAAKSWTGSARPRCCTSSCPTCPARFATARPASPCPDTTSNCAARTAGWSTSTRSAICISAARRQP